jgi:hypothetical protein
MTINSIIPEVWASRLLYNLNKNLVYAQPGVCNRDYSGDIASMGDVVHVNGIGPITVRPYVKNTPIEDPETLSDASTALHIDQGDYFNFSIDDADKAQTQPKVMDAAMAEAAYGISEVADDYIASIMVDNVSEENEIGSDVSPIVPNTTEGTTAFDYLVDLSTKLNEANVPKAGRWVIVPPWFTGKLVKDDRFTNISASGSSEALRNGYVSRIAGFDILESNSVPNTTGTLYKIVAGYPGAVTYAEQVSSIELYRPDDRLADACKGLHIYGSKVIRSSGLALLTANKTA